MNTLFRLCESLVFIDDFRQMWRELDETTTQRIAFEAEESTAAHVSSLLIFKPHNVIGFVVHIPQAKQQSEHFGYFVRIGMSKTA